MPQGAWRRADVLDSDPTGRFQVGTAQDETFTSHLIRWVNGVPEDLGTAHTSPKGINARGDIVGTDFDDMTYRYTGWIHHDGRFVELSGLGADHDVTPEAINTDGTIVGTSRGPEGHKPVKWAADGGIRPLALAPGTMNGRAVDIDDQGTVVGTLRNGDAAGHAARWRADGTVELLPEDQPGPDVSSDAAAVSGGTVIGSEYHEGSAQSDRALRWHEGAPGGPEVLGTAVPLAVNARGEAVISPAPHVQLFLVAGDGAMRPLPTDDPLYPTSTVSALTDDGIAFGHWMNSTPVLWDCRSATDQER